MFLADKGYDGNFLREELLIHRIRPVIPPKANRKNPPPCDFRPYKDRNHIKRMCNRLKQFRRVATRHDKTRKSFSAFLALAAAKIWRPYCAGPYAIMAKDRYGCTNRQKKLPIKHLEDQVCSNSKTISRHELERRVLDAIPANFLSVESTASIQNEINKLSTSRKAGARDKERLNATLVELTRKQDVVAAQVTERISNGQPQIDAFNRMLDDLQRQRNELEADLARVAVRRTGPPKIFVINPSMYSAAIAALKTITRTGNTEHDEVQRRFNFIRDLVQKVLVSPSADGKSPDLTIVGRLASNLASMRAFQQHSAGLQDCHMNEYARRVRAGEFRDSQEKLESLSHFRAVLAEAETEWKLLQYLVAGA